MFVLSEMQDTVRIEPHRFSQDMGQELSDELNKKFANKVVHKVGLCIALHDILHVGDSYIIPGDGASHTKVRFRFVVFRPFIDEILVGRITRCNPDGIIVSLEFFDDIVIPPQSLQHPKRFDMDKHEWIWEYQDNDLSMQVDDEIRFRVVEEIFRDTSPTNAQPKPDGCTTSPSESSGNGSSVPYSIVGSVSGSGLGLLSWWND